MNDSAMTGSADCVMSVIQWNVSTYTNTQTHTHMFTNKNIHTVTQHARAVSLQVCVSLRLYKCM